jgi:hypothetical protein
VHDDVVLTLRAMIQVSRYFADLIRGSSMLQYRRELFSAGLIDNSHHPCSLDERRKLCKEYVEKWTRKVKAVKRTHQVHGAHSKRLDRAAALGGDFLVLRQPYTDDHCHFLRVPPGANQRPIEGRELPQLPFEDWDSVAYPPADLLVVAEVWKK